MTLLCLSAATAFAQGDFPKTGTRVRVDAKERAIRAMTGTIQESRGDSLVIRPDNGDTMVVIPVMLVQRLQVSQGSRSNATEGFGGGMVVGASVGVVLALMDQSEKHRGANSRAEQAVQAGGVVGFLGGMIGLLGGSIVRTEYWKTVSSGEGRLRISATSTKSGIGLGGQFSY